MGEAVLISSCCAGTWSWFEAGKPFCAPLLLTADGSPIRCSRLPPAFSSGPVVIYFEPVPAYNPTPAWLPVVPLSSWLRLPRGSHTQVGSVLADRCGLPR